MTMDKFKSQNRGGKGIKGMQTIEEDYIEELFMTTTHHYIMFFTNTGRVYQTESYMRFRKQEELHEEQQSLTSSAAAGREDYSDHSVIRRWKVIICYGYEKGIVKKTAIQDYANVRKTGLAAIVPA